ncbi:MULTISPECIES: Ig-like domain-containing protein [Salinibaculum]|uniref:Ig-like domain-containing protein n=1 Tax=Salinibaculum TaxID=2732368 RepID=UPI0030CDE57A
MKHLSTPTVARSPVHRDGRAVSEVIGFILLFGLVIAGVSIIQTYGVPAQNERLEFDHNLRVQDDVVRLADGIETAGLTGAPVSATVEAGTDYPSRLFFFNPTPAAGTLQLGDPLWVNISNANATGDIGDYWDGSQRNFTTRPVVYTPDYNIYRAAPTTLVEYGVVYNANPNGVATVLKQGSFIRGDRITLVTVDGTFNRGSVRSISVEAVPISAPSRSVTLTPTGNMSLTIGTSLSVADWKDILADENASNGGRVTNVSSGPATGTVTIELDPNVSYELRLARVGIESGYDESASEPVYLTPVDSVSQTVPEGSTTEVTFEVRDAFNNPVSSQNVNISTQDGRSSVTPETVKTDADGRVRVTYTAPTFSGTTTITDRLNATFGPEVGSSLDPTAPENATVTFTLVNSDSSGVQIQTGTGQGGESDWSTENNTQQFTVANGRWNSIDSVNAITLSDGEMVTVERCKTGTPGNSNNTVFTECKFVDTLRLSFSLSNATDSYTADVNLEDCNQDGDFVDSCKVDKLTFEEESTVTLYDNSGSVIFEESLDTDGADGILSPGGTNILNITQYSAGSSNDLHRLKLTDATWLTSLIQGRVTVNITES